MPHGMGVSCATSPDSVMSGEVVQSKLRLVVHCVEKCNCFFSALGIEFDDKILTQRKRTRLHLMHAKDDFYCMKTWAMTKSSTKGDSDVERIAT
jgi:hypothetical protein